MTVKAPLTMAPAVQEALEQAGMAEQVQTRQDDYFRRLWALMDDPDVPVDTSEELARVSAQCYTMGIFCRCSDKSIADVRAQGQQIIRQAKQGTKGHPNRRKLHAIFDEIAAAFRPR